MIRIRSATAIVVLLLAGCATGPAIEPPPAPRDPGAAGCLAWYAALDRVIDEAGARDAGESRIADFPHLRADRFAASFRDAAVTDRAVHSALVQYLADLDLRARQFELINLPPALRPDTTKLGPCSRTLVAADLTGNRGPALLARLTVPDDYATAKRVLGAYALTAIPFFAGVTRWQDDTQAIFTAVKNREAVMRHVPAAPANIVANTGFSAAKRDAMGIPVLSPPEWQNLLARHAPVLDVVTRTPADRFGALQWRGDDIHVDTESPIAYSRVAYTRFQGETLVQLVYTYWFPERPRTGMFDPLGGRLDGLMVRITLDRDGQPLMVDSIHACGCYQLFFPSARLSPRPPPSQNIEWAFVPRNLPPLREGERIVLRVAAGTHYLEDIDVVAATSGDATYALTGEQRLRSLPRPDGTFRSAYSPDGLIAGSERGERFLFWPMGIASPGAMRQWGRHATAFVGRRHFDDADLIERRFERMK